MVSKSSLLVYVQPNLSSKSIIEHFTCLILSHYQLYAVHLIICIMLRYIFFPTSFPQDTVLNMYDVYYRKYQIRKVWGIVLLFLGKLFTCCGRKAWSYCLELFVVWSDHHTVLNCLWYGLIIKLSWIVCGMVWSNDELYVHYIFPYICIYLIQYKRFGDVFVTIIVQYSMVGRITNW